MLTGAIPDEYRRVTRNAQEGNRKVTGRLPECTGGLLEFAQEFRSRDSYVWEGSGGLLEVGRLQVEASLGLQIMLRLLAYSTPSHCPPPQAHQNATGGKFSAPKASSPVHHDDPPNPLGFLYHTTASSTSTKGWPCIMAMGHSTLSVIKHVPNFNVNHKSPSQNSWKGSRHLMSIISQHLHRCL